MGNTFLETHKKVQCSGCEACIQVCGKDAMAMKFDSEGFAYPEIDEDKCVNCGKCVKVCPYGNETLHHRGQQYSFGGYVKDEKVLEKSTSGGAFTAVAQAWCTGDYVVFGAVQKEDLMTEHRYITDLAQLDLLRKSKYSQSRIGTAYSDCKKFLAEGKKVLFSGTPCHIAGLRSFLGNKEYDNLLLIDVMCEGFPTPKYIRKFVDYMEKKHKSKVSSLDYRDKDNGKWDFNVMSLSFSNGKRIAIDRWINPFFNFWMQYIMSRPSCYECEYATRERVSDMTLGDLWGVHLFCPDLYNDNRGSSLIICNTEKGRMAFKQAEKYMHSRSLDLDTVVKYSGRMRSPVPLNGRRDEFLSDLDTMSFPKLKRKWVKRPSLKLLISKYVYGTNRQVVNRYLKRQGKKK